MTEHFDTVVIGGGQAGLATGHHLARRGREHVILDAGERVGDSWRRRWGSLRLYSPARYDALPGMAFPAPPLSFPTGMQMADYLEAYARRFDLPVRSGVEVDGLTRGDGRYLVTAGERRIEADNVVVATGTFRRPVTPGFAADLDPAIRQLHSDAYRSPEQLQEGPVLVVGAAHSGADIAMEAAQAGHPTILSGRSTGQIPWDIEGRMGRMMWPAMRFVATRVLTARTPMGRKARGKIRAHGGPLLRYKEPHLRAAGVERVTERTAGADGGRPRLDGGRVLDVANVVWCTGYRNDFDWIDLPVFGEDGYPRQQRGVVAESPGLYFVGLLFLHSFSSMLILGAGRDAERVVRHLERARRTGRREPARGAVATA